MSRPYYEADGVTIYHGDARALLPSLSGGGRRIALITDPVWPNAHPDLAGADDPAELLTETLAALPPDTDRLVIWLGVQSDPRFLMAVPPRFPFLRACYLRRAVPGYNGRCLVSGDVLYAFGEWPSSREGRRVLPGEAGATSDASKRQPHPCTRNADHAMWVVKWWGDPEEVVIDPFMGTGTTLWAARELGIPAIGIEVDEEHCETAVRRLTQGVLDFGGAA